MKEKQLPEPGTLETRISPRINSASFWRSPGQAPGRYGCVPAAVQLPEGLEDRRYPLRRDADAGVANLHRDVGVGVVVVRSRQAYIHAAEGVNLMALSIRQESSDGANRSAKDDSR